MGLGLGSGVFDVINGKCEAEQAKEILNDFEACYEDRPWLAMVNSDKGITNLHAPNDIIIDASMPVVIRDSGKMWNKLNELEDTKCLIPDRCYATMYQEVISYVKTKGQFDVATMGNVSNVGLMAKKAEEYGSHDKTFEIPKDGTVRVKDINTNEVYFEHDVSKGDIWRMAQTKEESIKDWVKLAVDRARATKSRTIFCLDKNRGHDRVLIDKVTEYLKDHDTDGLDIGILAPKDAMAFTLTRCRAGQDTISVTGNVLRDYLTDLFPIIELGTSAKMLSIVPLLEGGGLYETGAGGSAPKHVEQLVSKGHLRWDSLGEFLALAVSIEELAMKSKNKKASVLAVALHKANEMFLDNERNPGRSPGTLPTAGSHFYLNLYWARALSEQTDDAELAAKFKGMYDELLEKEEEIVTSLKNLKEKAPLDIGGYFRPDPVKATAVMRPVAIYNSILEKYGEM